MFHYIAFLAAGLILLFAQNGSTSRKTQRSQILEILIRAGGRWVPLPEIMARAAQFGARIFELRRMGFHIENRTELVNGRRQSWYRLLTGASTQAKTPASTTPPRDKSPQTETTQALFPKQDFPVTDHWRDPEEN